MEEIGLFPLELVLLPTELAPLHIFEPRYRELIGECLEEEREFGLVLQDGSGMRNVGTTAGVVEVLTRFEDGRLNIVIEGRRRFRLERLTGGRSFQTGLIEELADTGAEATAREKARLLSEFKRVVESAGADVPEPDEAEPRLAFRLAAQVELALEAKQELLELDGERDRTVRLTSLFAEVQRALEWRASARERAATNGKVEPPSHPQGRSRAAPE